MCAVVASLISYIEGFVYRNANPGSCSTMTNRFFHMPIQSTFNWFLKRVPQRDCEKSYFNQWLHCVFMDFYEKEFYSFVH